MNSIILLYIISLINAAHNVEEMQKKGRLEPFSNNEVQVLYTTSRQTFKYYL